MAMEARSRQLWSVFQIYPCSGQRLTISPQQMYGVGSSGFGSADYANRGMPVNVMMGPMYGGNSTQGAPAVLRYGRRPGSDQPPVTPRSPLLEEFRMNKARKWEIKVRSILECRRQGLTFFVPFPL